MRNGIKKEIKEELKVEILGENSVIRSDIQKFALN